MSHIPYPLRYIRFLLVLVVIVIMTWATFTSHSSKEPTYSTAEKANITTKREQKLPRLFKKQNIVNLDVSAVARRVRESGQLLLVTQVGTFDLNLIPNDLRAYNYRAEEVGPEGIARPIEIGSVHTYKGTVRGMNGAQARFTISNEIVEGLIQTNAESYFIEPAKRYSALAAPSEFVVYRASDIADESVVKCDATMADKISRSAEQVMNGSSVPTSNRLALGRIAKIATEADFEFVSARGGSSQANSAILSELNMVEGLYEQELGITFEITFQHTWATSDDPYVATDRFTIGTEFRNYWEANFQSIQRNLAYMWTGKPDGGLAIGGNCTQSGYGVTSGLHKHTTAHEIGHILGATHPDQFSPPVEECAGTIMQSIQARDLTFCPFSRNQIAEGTITKCLSMSPDSCATLMLSSTYTPFGPNSGASAFRVEASLECSWTARSNTDWISITSGNSGTGSGTVNYSVTANTSSATRTGTITIGNRTFTISQDSPACAPVVLPLSWWRAENNANDSVGPNHGALFGTATFATGLVGQAFNFNWVNVFDDYFYAPTIGLPKVNNDMTVEFWFRFGNSDSDANLNAHFESYIGGATRSRYEIRISPQFRQISFLGDELPFLTSSTPSLFPEWHHVAVTNQGNNVTIYVDGASGASGTVPINIPNSTAFYMGKGSKGFMDEVSVYNRALTPAEIQSIFLARSAGKCGAANATLTPMLITEGATTRAIALDSVTLIRDPFPFVTTHNFSSDQRTRIMLFAVNLELKPGENASVVTAQVEDSQHRIYPLTVEHVGKVPNVDQLTQVNVRLPDELANGGDVSVSINLRGTVSNKALISIRQSQ